MDSPGALSQKWMHVEWPFSSVTGGCEVSELGCRMHSHRSGICIRSVKLINTEGTKLASLTEMSALRLL